MKTTELRIGNFISRNDLGDDSERIEIIIELGKMALTTGPINVMCEYDEIKPIPLTEEWLVKFGWGKGEFDSEYIDNVSLKQEVLVYNVNAKMLCIETNRDIMEISHILYVHQLQNLFFALTGEELTIK